MIFISVTYIEGTPLFKGKGQVFLVLKPGFNLHSGDTLALKTWLTTKKVDIFKCTLMTMMAAFTNWTISLTSIYCNIFCHLSFLNKKKFLPSKSKHLSKNKISIKITLFIDLCQGTYTTIISYQYIWIIEFFERSLCIGHLFHFLFSQQVTAVATGIDMIPRHSFSRWWTSQDGHLWNCLRQGHIVITDVQYTTARLMDLLSVEAMTFTLPTTRHQVAVPTPTLTMITAHQVGTAMEAPSPRHF